MRAALLMWVIGCGGGTEPVPPGPPPVVVTTVAPSCEITIHTAAQRIIVESMRVALATTIDRTASVMIASCEAEAWPASVLACIAAARLDVDLEACTEELSYRQHKRLHDKIAQVTPPPTPPPTLPTIVVPLTRPPRPRPPSPTATVDCSQRITAPTNTACIRQYCLTHATEALCMAE